MILKTSFQLVHEIRLPSRFRSAFGPAMTNVMNWMISWARTLAALSAFGFSRMSSISFRPGGIRCSAHSSTSQAIASDFRVMRIASMRGSTYCHAERAHRAWRLLEADLAWTNASKRQTCRFFQAFLSAPAFNGFRPERSSRNSSSSFPCRHFMDESLSLAVRPCAFQAAGRTAGLPGTLHQGLIPSLYNPAAAGNRAR